MEEDKGVVLSCGPLPGPEPLPDDQGDNGAMTCDRNYDGNDGSQVTLDAMEALGIGWIKSTKGYPVHTRMELFHAGLEIWLGLKKRKGLKKQDPGSQDLSSEPGSREVEDIRISWLAPTIIFGMAIRTGAEGRGDLCVPLVVEQVVQLVDLP